MQQQKRPRSLRQIMLLVIGLCLLVFISVFLIIVQSNMSKILLQSESEYMGRLHDVSYGAFASVRIDQGMAAKDIAFWDQTVRFIGGKNPNYLSNWPGNSILQNSKFHFVLIKDADGKDALCEYIADASPSITAMPEGLSQRLDEAAQNMLAEYASLAPANVGDPDIGAQAVTAFGGETYLISAMPVIDPSSHLHPAGAVIVGSRLSNLNMRALTNFHDMDFEILEGEPTAAYATEQAYIVPQGDQFIVELPLETENGGIGASPYMLRISAHRSIYTEGQRIIDYSNILFLSAAIVFVMVLYMLVYNLVLRPVEHLSSDVERVGIDGRIDEGAYQGNAELSGLCAQINRLIVRLRDSESLVEKTSLSMNVIESVLDGADAMLYVSDPETDELLYVNKEMRRQFALSDDVAGKICYEHLQLNQTGRCDFCPKHTLKENPDAVVVWEDRSLVTGRYYRKTDRLIDWPNGKKVHLQHGVDITDIQSAQQETRDMKQRLETALMASGAGIWEIDYASGIITYDDASRALFSVNMNENSQPIGALVEHLETVMVDYAKSGFFRELIAHPDDDIFMREYRIKRQDGSISWLRNYTNTLVDDAGSPLRTIGMSMDITGIKGAQLELARRLEQQELMSAMIQSFISAEDTQLLINNALQTVGEFMDLCEISIACLHEDTGLLRLEHAWFNEHYGPPVAHPPVSLTRTPLSSAFAASIRPYVTGEDIPPGQWQWLPFAREDLRAFLSVPVYTDSALWGVMNFCECRYPRGFSESDIQLIHALASVISGVVQRERTEEILVRMSSVAESAPLFVAYVTMDGHFEYVNLGAVNITGYTEQELLQGSLSMLFSQEVHRRAAADIAPHVLKYGKYKLELPIRRKDGHERLISLSAFRTGYSSVGVGVIATDITDERRLENALIAAKEQAEEASLAKGEFLSRMSHEMRTPMNAIIGMTSIAKSSPDDNQRLLYCLDKIDGASKHLLGIINDVLDMSKIEANKFELSPREFDFEKMLRRVVDVVNFRVEEKHQRFIIELDNLLPKAIVADDLRLAQVITNFLSNAVKFTPEHGTITLSARVVSQTGPLYKLLLSVTDTGIGISEESQKRLFRSFEQADGSISRKFGGTGLGLAISKKIVELMGGRIWVESTAGEGSSFKIEIDAPRGEAIRHTLLSPDINHKNLRILAVDDDAVIRDYFLGIMDHLKLSCDVAASGEEAVACMEKSGGAYNIIFVDWKMPGMDGIELTKQLKARKDENNVVIMISAAQWGEIETEARAAGVERFISKPLFPSVLMDCINECLSHETEQNDSAASTHTDFTGRHILLAEDIEINREIVLAFLEDTGISISSAENGVEAVRMFTQEPGKYDVIFMDIHMPDMDGFEATRRIRALEDIPMAQRIPIVAMTANVFREDVEKCMAVGMNDHIGKPVDRDELIAKLKRYLP